MLEKFQVAISPQPVVRSTSCFVRGRPADLMALFFRFEQIQDGGRKWPYLRNRSSDEYTSESWGVNGLTTRILAWSCASAGVPLGAKETETTGLCCVFSIFGIDFYRAMHFSAKRGIAIACRMSVCLSVCPSVCDVGGLWSHRLEFFENNFTVS